MTQPYGHWPICGDCPDCLERTNALLRGPARRTATGPGPTAARLERHAALYGSAGVAETAAQYGLSVAIVEDKKPKRRRMRRR